MKLGFSSYKGTFPPRKWYPPMSHRPFIPWVWYSFCSWTLTGHPWTENQIHTQGEIIVVRDLWEPRHFWWEETVTPKDVIWIWKEVVIKEVAMLLSAVGSCHPALLLGGLPGWAEWASTGESSWGLKTVPVLQFQECVGAAALRWHFPPLLLWREPGPTWMGVLYEGCGWARAPW